MNFLAHCLIGEQARISEPWRVPLIVGGFLGDFVKGIVPQDMPPQLALGVRLHRRVDAYSNRQPFIRRSCERFPTELRRFAPIFVDIIADHLLARNWADHHRTTLSTFTRTVYDAVDEHREWLSEPGLQFLDYARDSDLLARYLEWSVIARSLTSVARRIRRPELAAQVVSASERLLDDFSLDFDQYFPDILKHAQEWAADHQAVIAVR